MNEGNILVFDIGGTNSRAALFRATTGQVDHVVVEPTPNLLNCLNPSQEHIYRELLALIEKLGKAAGNGEKIDAVSVALPGPIGTDGRIIALPGIWGENPAEPIDITVDLQKFWPGLPIYILNDMTAAGYRYRQSEQDSFCLVTVSTGIGNKIFIDGKPQLGPRGTGGEIGHLKVLHEADAPLCDCGERGHLQAIASGRGALNHAKKMIQEQPALYATSRLKELNTRDNLSNQELVAAYHAQDTFTVKIINDCTRPLAEALAMFYAGLGLERFVIIGGFAFALGDAYLKTLAHFAGEVCWHTAAHWEEMLCWGDSDDLSGLVGAGLFAHKRY